MAFAVLVAGHAASRASAPTTPPDRVAAVLLLKAFDASASADAFCHHKSQKKRHCRHAGRATATAIEPGTKRKTSKPASTHTSLWVLSPAVQATSPKPDELHLRMTYSTIYAATRRMHI